MKKLLFFLCILLFTSTVYAGDFDMQDELKENIFTMGLYNMKYISIDRMGQIAYIIDNREINELFIKLEDIISNNDFDQQKIKEQKNELKPVAGSQYRICFYADDESGEQATVFFIYNSGEFEVIGNDTETRKTWLRDEELSQLLSFVEKLFEKQNKYDTFLPLNTTNLTELGIVLDGDLYVFENAYINSEGSLYISLKDWNAIFSPTYGDTKKLSVRNSEVIYNYKDTGIQGKLVQNKIYLPLRETVGFFTQFDMKWDAQLRKVIISEREHSSIFSMAG